MRISNKYNDLNLSLLEQNYSSEVTKKDCIGRVFTGNYEECKIGNLISISGDRGKKVGFKGKAIPELAPKKDFWKIWHSNIGKIPDDENTKYYIRHYFLEVLSKVDIEELLKDEKDPILLCYEKGQDFCHRHVLAEYINILYGIEVHDIKIDEGGNIEKNKRPENVRKILEQVLREEYNSIENKRLKERMCQLGIVKELKENER